MSKPQFLINYYLEAENVTLEELRKTLYKNGLFSKEYVEDGLMLVYHKFEQPIRNELERECRTLVIDTKTLKMVSCCENVRLNQDGMEYMVANSTSPTIINTCYEGTLLSMFHHNNKWYVATRRCLNSSESIFNGDVSHFEMFEDVLRSTEYKNFDTFTEQLDKNNSYYFLLIHHKNKNMINYEPLFGKNYTRLCLTTIRDPDMRELDLYENKNSFASYDINSPIFVSEKLASIEEFANKNKTLNYDLELSSEGIVCRIWDNMTNKYKLIKLQSINYQFVQIMGPDKDIFKGLVYLYQNNKLIDYFNQNPKTRAVQKIVNPFDTNQSYDTVGVIDAVFKVCTSELFELFKVLWSVKTGEHKNVELYNMLPKEYKDLLFGIRGIYYKKKTELFNKNKENMTLQDYRLSHLKINDIYNYLKVICTDTFISFLRMRRLMFNWVNNSDNKLNSKLAEFETISQYCDKVHSKLCTIFTNKLYPNIMMNDYPPQKEKEKVLVATI